MYTVYNRAGIAPAIQLLRPAQALSLRGAPPARVAIVLTSACWLLRLWVQPLRAVGGISQRPQCRPSLLRVTQPTGT